MFMFNSEWERLGITTTRISQRTTITKTKTKTGDGSILYELNLDHLTRYGKYKHSLNGNTVDGIYYYIRKTRAQGYILETIKSK